MSIIEPVKQNPLYSTQSKKYPATIRTWHWLNMLVIAGSLLTVLLTSTLMDRQTVSDVITKLPANGAAAITAETTKQIAHDLQDKVWEVHAYIGFVLIALLLWRIIYEITCPVTQSIFRKVNIARIAFKNGGEEKRLARHDLAVKSLYLLFYVVLIAMGITGTLLFFKSNLELSRPMAHQIQEFHGFCMYIVIAFIVVHVAGVVLTERKQSPGIVSDMINGGGQ